MPPDEEVSLVIAQEIVPGATSKTLARLVDLGLSRAELARVGDDADFFGCRVSTIARWMEQGISIRSVECHLEVKKEFPYLTMPVYLAILDEFGPFEVELLIDMLDDMLVGDADGRDVSRMIYVVRKRFSGDFKEAAKYAHGNAAEWARLMKPASRYSRRT